MPKYIDLSGKRFGMITVVSLAESRNLHTYWVIKCDCGTIREMGYNSIMGKPKTDTIKSCGCMSYSEHAKRLTTHGMKGTLEIDLLNGAKRRAKVKGLPINISVFDIKIPEICPLLGIPIYKKGGKITDNSPSLDKINPNLGYVKGNIWVISYKANAVKNNCSLEELELLVTNFKKYAARELV